MSLIAVLLGAVGAILSVFKNRWCFAVWIPVNCYWIWFNWPGIQSWVFVVMSASCIAGWIAWGINEINRRQLVEQNAYFRQGWTQAQDRIIQLLKGIEAAIDSTGPEKFVEGVEDAGVREMTEILGITVKGLKDEKENDSVDMCRISRAVGMCSDEQEETDRPCLPDSGPGGGRVHDE